MKLRSAAVAIAITFGQLVAGKISDWTPEQQLVIDALRRSNNSLTDATAAELGEYLSSKSPEQMSGVVSNVKGIFHELIVAAAENADGDNINAVLFEATNHPGADIEFTVDGETIQSVQLKAVQDPASIIEHFEKYPDVDVLATLEVTEILQGAFGTRLSSSGFSNQEITEETRKTFEELAGENLSDFIQDGFLTSTLIVSALQARSLLSGEKIQPKQIRSLLELAGIATGTALAVDTVLSLL